MFVHKIIVRNTNSGLCGPGASDVYRSVPWDSRCVEDVAFRTGTERHYPSLPRNLNESAENMK